MSEDPELFYSPRLQYLSMKKTFLGKFLDRKVWGEFGSEEQLVAVSGLLEYYRETRSLSEHFPQILDEVIIDNKKLVLERVLPLPPKLYEQILGAAVEEGYQLFWQQPASVILNRMESFLVKKKAACLAAYEHQIWTEVHDYENYTFDN